MILTAGPGCLHGDFNRSLTVVSFLAKKYREVFSTIENLKISNLKLIPLSFKSQCTHLTLIAKFPGHQPDRFPENLSRPLSKSGCFFQITETSKKLLY